jgi:RES domain-containing protein
LSIAAWRIVQERHSARAFTGEGARIYGGRWNSPGVAVVYTAQSRALAALEMLVHLDSPGLLSSYLLYQVDFEEAWVTKLDAGSLPSDWRDDPPPASTQAIGDQWIRSNESPVLRVPSVLISEEVNFLLNPRHRQFERLRIGRPEAFAFDPRLAER